jgi:hypothetical protein
LSRLLIKPTVLSLSAGGTSSKTDGTNLVTWRQLRRKTTGGVLN